ncbi:MAG: glycosyltransferase family 87 protein [Candidatus Limnocylindrales bacterium]
MTALMRLSPGRIGAILLLALTGGVVFALLWQRGQLAGSDAFAYWTAVHRWLGGQDIYQVIPGLNVPPSEGPLPFAYAPWSLYLFLPWAALPWDIAWFVWRAANIALFAWSVAWAYDRRPLATAVIVAILGPALAANLDTGNINVLIVLGVWLGWFASARLGGARLGGLAWAVGAALKFMPAPLLVFVPRAGWRYGLAALAILFVITLATWPQVTRQLDIVLNYPRPLRIDYMLLAWAAVPWLWARDWPPRLDRTWFTTP